jgi:glycerol-3-phosphate dehydrogenase
VAGGKLTTWRVTAEEAVDAALARLPRERAAATGPAATAGAPLVGRAPRDLAARLLATVAAPARLSHGVAGALARRLRALAPLALDLARNGAELAPLEEGTDLCVAEARVHFRHGMVLRLEDLLLRRTRLGTWSPRAALAIAPRLAALAREEMGWGGARFDREHERLESALAGWRPEGACG